MFRKLFKVILFLSVVFSLSAAAADAPSKAKEKETKVVLTQKNTIIMDMEFTSENVAKVMLQAQALDSKLLPWKPLYLVILSGGGSIEAGLELIDNLNALGRPIHTVSIFAASMAFQTAEGLGSRYITTNGTLMSHKAKGEFSGEFPGQLDSRYAFYLKRVLRQDETVVAKSKGKLTLEQYRAMYANEFWCDGQSCVDVGVADAVASVSCDDTLKGTRNDVQHFNFMGMNIEVTFVKAACPTITGILDFKVKVDGQDLIITNLDNVSTQIGITVEQAAQLRNMVELKLEEVTPSKKVKRY